MKFQSNTLLPELKKAELKNLTAITKETLDAPLKKSKKFTSVDFWNIQKQRRVFSQRNFIQSIF